MSDIVKELRDAGACWDTDAWRLCGSAADEIERLREALRKIAKSQLSDSEQAFLFKMLARAALGGEE